jgi:hypothetical protein
MNNLKELYLTYPVENLFFELTKDIIIKYDEIKYPNSIFYFKDDICIFKYDKNNGYFYCDYYRYWSKFYEKFGFNYNQISDLTKDMVEKHFNLKGVTPNTNSFTMVTRVEKHFNLKKIKHI